jgi:hypothetical protein
MHVRRKTAKRGASLLLMCIRYYQGDQNKESEVSSKEVTNAYKDSVGKPEAENTIWKTRRRWEDNIKMGLK